jgi:hypothetical protein
VHFGRRFLPDGSVEVQRWEPDGTWSEFLKISAEDANTTWLDGISADRRSAFVMDSRGRNTAALTEVDLATRESRVLAEDPEADIVSAAYDPNSDRPYAAVSIAARQRWHLIDPAGVDLTTCAQHGGGRLPLTAKVARADASSPHYRSDAAGEFRLYDRSKQTLKPLFKSRTDDMALRPWTVAERRVPLPGYLRPQTPPGTALWSW